MSKFKKIVFVISYYLVLIIVLVTVTMKPAAVIGTDVLQNGGFETGNVSPWFIVSSGTIAGSSTIVAPGHTGAFAEKFSITKTGSGWYELAQIVPVDQGTTYNVQFWYKSSVNSGGVAFYCYDRPWSNVVAASGVEIVATGDTWTLGTFRISIPVNGTIAHTELLISLGNTTGTLVLDDVNMTVIDLRN